MKPLLGLVVVVILALVLGAVMFRSASDAQGAGHVSLLPMEPVDDQLAVKAENSCWFKVTNRSGRSDERRRWSAVASTGASTAKVGELLIVTGAMEPPVRDDRFYGCSLFQYNQGSPVVMTATTSPVPVRADNVIPFGFSHDGRKLQQ